MHKIADGKDVETWMLRDGTVLRAAYPNGVPPEEYDLLIYVLADTMSFRGVSQLLDHCGIRDYTNAYQDVMGVVDRHDLYAERAKPVLEKLIRHGYDPTAE
jgi:hypothetical protein